MTLPVVIFICLLSWTLVSLFFQSEIEAAQQTYTSYAFFRQLGVPEMPTHLQYLLGFPVYLLIAYTLTILNNTFALIRIRATVQTAVFLLFVTTCPMIYPLSESTLTSFCLLLSLYFLFKSYQQHSPIPIFYAFFLLGTSCIFLPQMIYLTPMWLVGAACFQALNLRNLLGALAGITLPFWFLFAHAFFYNNMALFTGCFEEMIHFYPLSSLLTLPMWMITFCIFLAVVALISTIHIIAYSYEDKIQTRAYLLFLIRFSVYLIVFFLVQPVHGNTLLVTLTQVASILAAHFFLLTNNRSSNIIFIAVLISLLTLLVTNLWMLS